MQTPAIGRIVHYRLSAADADAINRRRTSGSSIAERLKSETWPVGAQAHIGSFVNKGDVVPLTITKVWPDEYAGGAYLAHHEPGTKYDSTYGVNGQATLDGTDSLWVCSAPQHETATGCWFWPPRE